MYCERTATHMILFFLDKNRDGRQDERHETHQAVVFVRARMHWQSWRDHL